MKSHKDRKNKVKADEDKSFLAPGVKSYSKYTVTDLIQPEPVLRDLVNIDDRKKLFIKKLNLCTIIFDFTPVDEV